MEAARCMGVSHASVSVLNAIPTGIGAAIPINLYTKSSIELVLGGQPGVSGQSVINGKAVKVNKIILENIRLWLEDMLGKNVFLNVTVKSNIPVGMGLKSSSALVTSILTGINKCLKLGLGYVDIAKKCVEISKKANLTVTGGFDDCISTITDRIVVTDNHMNMILKELPASQVPVDILIPEGEKRADVILLKKMKTYYMKAVEELFDNHIKSASLINGFLTSFAIGRNMINMFVKVMFKENLFAASVSGRGPAIYVAVKEDKDFPSHFSNNHVIRTTTIGTGR